jgi:hypothetical protein
MFGGLHGLLIEHDECMRKNEQHVMYIFQIHENSAH